MVDWSAFGLRTPGAKAKPKTTFRPGRQHIPEGQQLKDKEYAARQIRRLKEKYTEDIRKASVEYLPFRRWLDTIRREEPNTTMPRSGYLDWNAVELAEKLKMHELPEEIRWLAFRCFSQMLKRVTKQKYGYEEGPLLPFDELKDADFEAVKRALKLN